jgi:hypothetical protein
VTAFTEFYSVMIDDDTLKQVLRINDELSQLVLHCPIDIIRRLQSIPHCVAFPTCHSRIGAERNMERLYKDHRIQVLVWLDSDRWLVKIFIYYSDGVVNTLSTLAMNEKFTTYHEAIEASLAAAKKWIDVRTY